MVGGHSSSTIEIGGTGALGVGGYLFLAAGTG
jgi:hypothetical protein